MSLVDLFFSLLTCYFYLFGVDNDYIIAAVNVWSVDRFLLPLRIEAISEAILPRVLPSASITYHLRSISAGFAINDFISFSFLPTEFDGSNRFGFVYWDFTDLRTGKIVFDILKLIYLPQNAGSV